MKIIFIVPSVNDSHARNRILEFIDKGYNVIVYGFDRTNQKKVDGLPYEIEILGTLTDESYAERIKLYWKKFRYLGKMYKSEEVLFFLLGLDIAMFFHFINPKYRYIYEECDLTHTYIRKLKDIFEYIDKKIIRSSLLTITTSEGFINYHFKGSKPNNVCLVENKLNPVILKYKIKPRKSFNKDNISIGFVGVPRFDSVYNFIDVYCRTFPQHTFHIYGGPIPKKFESLKKYRNCIFHGFFNNPTDLPEIYSNIDLVPSTYDVKYENVRFAEPNKIYESIYFEKPIIVSSGTFLAEKVSRLVIGYSLDAMNDKEIIDFIFQLQEESLMKICKNAHLIDKEETLNINDHLFSMINESI